MYRYERCLTESFFNLHRLLLSNIGTGIVLLLCLLLFSHFFHRLVCILLFQSLRTAFLVLSGTGRNGSGPTNSLSRSPSALLKIEFLASLSASSLPLYPWCAEIYSSTSWFRLPTSFNFSLQWDTSADVVKSLLRACRVYLLSLKIVICSPTMLLLSKNSATLMIA